MSFLQNLNIEEIVSLVFIITIGLYILESIFLSKFNKLIYKKGTIMAFIPFARTFLLGKLTFGEKIGWTLLFFELLSNGFVLENYQGLFIKIYSIVRFILLMYAIVKYFEIKKDEAVIFNTTLNTPYDNMRNNYQGINYQNLQDINNQSDQNYNVDKNKKKN